MKAHEPPLFAVAEHRDGVALRGEIDLAAKDELSRRFEAVLTPGRHVVVDLAEVSFMDSSGIEALCAARRQASRTGGSITLRGPNALVLRTLALTGVDVLFEIDGRPADGAGDDWA